MDTPLVATRTWSVKSLGALRLCLHDSQNTPAVKLRHVEVKQYDEPARMEAQALERLHAIIRFIHGVARIFQRKASDLAKAGVVINDQDIECLLQRGLMGSHAIPSTLTPIGNVQGHTCWDAVQHN